MEKYTIDRFEGEIAVLLLSGDETIMKDIPKEQFSDGVNEGDVNDKLDSTVFQK